MKYPPTKPPYLFVLGTLLTAAAVLATQTIWPQLALHTGSLGLMAFNFRFVFTLISGAIGVFCFNKLVEKRLLIATGIIAASLALKALLLTFSLFNGLGYYIAGHSYVAGLLVSAVENALLLAVLIGLTAMLPHLLPARIRHQPSQQLVLFIGLFLICFAGYYLHTTQLRRQAIVADREQNVWAAISLPFATYVPAYSQPGLNVSGATNGGSTTSTPQYFTISYDTNDLDKSGYQLDEFASVAAFNPPNCGPSAPTGDKTIDSSSVGDCVPIGNAQIGCTVYYVSPESTSSNDVTAYCKLNGTMVTFTAVEGSNINQSEILKIFNSLHQASSAELQSLVS